MLSVVVIDPSSLKVIRVSESEQRTQTRPSRRPPTTDVEIRNHLRGAALVCSKGTTELV